jgi:hypothetical protein
MTIITSSNINGIIINHPGDATSLALKLLVENCIRLQEHEFNKNNNEQHFLREFCTVRMATSRRAGHSTAAKMIMERFANPQLVCVNEVQKRYAIERGVKKGQCVATTENLNALKGMHDVDAVIVDCAHSHVYRELREDDLYYLAASIRRRDFPFCMIFIA